ncbi:MAG: hypothetical protein GAK35_01041 [Herbaspirillum frisingense]|uniref:Uncharacterized protein n=1 Tax=Herbaspirillum frisingense TaxID=92645 RepID=A0A7V8FYZ2_9BURK|nr:MAG: hypothetical protein GAK35_01041 [Herbaspirillum frisingense]
MNLLKITTEASITATLSLTEGQLRGLQALAAYGDTAFFKAFYVKLGKSSMQPVEADMRELFELIRRDVSPALSKIDTMRKNFNLPKSNMRFDTPVENVDTFAEHLKKVNQRYPSGLP